jgi:hypothetical protein
VFERGQRFNLTERFVRACSGRYLPGAPSRPPVRRVGIRVRCAAVAAWQAIERTEPEFAGRVRKLFDAGRNKTIATLRADGSPRISGIECEFTGGELRFGSMNGARKGADLKRDPRFALHGPTFHPEAEKEREWPGKAKIAGRAVPASPVTTDETAITEVVITALNAEATKLVIESWTPGERAEALCSTGLLTTMFCRVP